MPSSRSQDDPARIRYDRVAAFYDAFDFLVDHFISWQRREILRLAKGRILEIGVGTGTSFKDYLHGERIVAVDISREMLRRAEDRAKHYSGSVKILREDVQNLPFEDESFDTVFSSLVFCSVTDPIKGLSEVRRVLMKGGQLLMLEHVRSRNRVAGRLMDKLNPLVARFGVDNINRDTAQYVRNAGFKIERERTFYMMS